MEHNYKQTKNRCVIHYIECHAFLTQSTNSNSHKYTQKSNNSQLILKGKTFKSPKRLKLKKKKEETFF